MSNQKTIGKILLDINDTLIGEIDQSFDHLEEVLFQEIDSALTYYSTQWDILNEARPSTFELEQLGELARSPQELAWDILYTKYMEFYGINEPPEYRTPEETTEKDFKSSQYDQLIEDGLVPIDHVTDRINAIDRMYISDEWVQAQRDAQ